MTLVHYNYSIEKYNKEVNVNICLAMILYNQHDKWNVNVIILFT